MSSRRDLVGALTALIRLIDTADNLTVVRAGAVFQHACKVADQAHLIEQLPWTPFEERQHQPPSATQIKALMRYGNISEADALTQFANNSDCRLYINSRYQVQLRELGKYLYLSIKRIDQLPIHDWRDLQRIKDELVGAECEAIELYPAQSRVVDTANQYHLWVVQDESYRFPVGFQGGRLISDVDDAQGTGAAQRPL
jgi:hypothetical protein